MPERTLRPRDHSTVPTIIYVEDNAGDAILLRDALLECKHDVALSVIDKGDKALHYFEIKSQVHDIPPPHCILLDTHLPIVTGMQLIAYLRQAPAYNDTPVYLFASEADYLTLKSSTKISSESFLTKPDSWQGFLDLGDLLMKSAEAKADDAKASPTDSKPEVHATGGLRMHR